MGGFGWTGAVIALALSASPVLAEPSERADVRPLLAVTAVPAVGGGVHISWRLGTHGAKPRFILRRDGRVIATQTGRTSYRDAAGRLDSLYVVETEGAASAAAPVWNGGYLAIPLDRPADRITPTGEAYGYTANDASIGDLDGDGRPEILLKWDPTVSRDNAFGGYSGETLLDAYTLEGKRLWRIDLGPNIRSGAHYTPFMVADFDGDGRAEVMARTSDGTVDGTGTIIGDAVADWREKGGAWPSADRTGSTTTADGRRVADLTGRILSGPEYLTVFDGATGKALATETYAPTRGAAGHETTGEEMTALWGDAYANRSDRFLAAIAWLDGQRPSAIFARGYYARTVLAAWDWRDGKLTRRWLFDSAAPGNAAFDGQGNHQMAIADIDGDGRQEVVYGSMALDDDGSGLWSARLFHGDALHVGDLDPARPGLERFGVHEEMRNGHIGAAMLDARTGGRLWTTPAEKDTGRGVALDIDPRFPGAEAWASNDPDLRDAKGRVIAGGRPRAMNFGIWWDGDVQRELLDGNRILKWDWRNGKEVPILVAEGAASNNGTKATPALSADILGDWREEVLLRSADNSELRLYATPYPTRVALPPLMDDPQYRAAVAWQNSGYNQPPHPSFDLATRAGQAGERR